MSAGELGRSRGLDQLGFFGKVTAHPADDAFWQGQALDKLLAARGPLTVPTMLVHSLWDQEDIYGNIAVWHALAPHDPNHMLHLTIGPWFHHQERLDGSAIGAIRFGTDTAAWWRDNVLTPFLLHALTDDHATAATPTVTAYETGTDRWQRLGAWPACDDGPGCRIAPTPLYLAPGHALALARPAPSDAAVSYLADPAHPVPFIPRPVHLGGAAGETDWQHWLVSDQRTVSDRPDVLSFETPPLDHAVHIAGQPVADIDETTTGTDADVVVKVIDVYPDENGRDPELGGYQLMISADILRGRYRDGGDPADAGAGQPADPLPLHPADDEPRVPARSPRHGAGAVELVPALRPQPADLGRQHLLGCARRLPGRDRERRDRRHQHDHAPGRAVRSGGKSTRPARGQRPDEEPMTAPPRSLAGLLGAIGLIGSSVAASSAAAAPDVATSYPMSADLWTMEPAIVSMGGETGAATFARYEGMPTGTMTLNGGVAASRTARSAAGSIDFDIKPLGYDDAGVVFHREGSAEGEFVYLRADPDCPAADDCIQYAPITHTMMGWNVYPNDQGPAPISPTGWNHVHIEVAAQGMRVYVNHAAEPSLVVPTLWGSRHDGGPRVQGTGGLRQPRRRSSRRRRPAGRSGRLGRGRDDHGMARRAAHGIRPPRQPSWPGTRRPATSGARSGSSRPASSISAARSASRARRRPRWPGSGPTSPPTHRCAGPCRWASPRRCGCS